MKGVTAMISTQNAIGRSDMTGATNSFIMTNPFQAMSGYKALEARDPEAALKKVSKDFEAIFVNMLIKAMRKTVPETGLFGSDSASDTYQDMFDEQLAVEMSQGRGLGLADVIYRQLSQKDLSGSGEQANQIMAKGNE
jgi:peptidoglycan hydrolase FlgJ